MMKRESLVKEEERIHRAGIAHFHSRHVQALSAVKKLVGLDYFGIDFSILPSNELVLFEANATMNFFPFVDDDKLHYSRHCLPRAVAAMRRLIGGS